MAGEAGPLAELDRYFAAATIAHEYIADLHRELAVMGADDERTRTLVRASADITLRLMPELSKEVRHLGRTWRDQEVLNPPEAERTAELIQARLAALTPQLTELRQRQDEIARELRDLIRRERDG